MQMKCGGACSPRKNTRECEAEIHGNYQNHCRYETICGGAPRRGHWLCSHHGRCCTKGILSLIQRSVKENAVTVVSVFVNPTQFCPGEDYEAYPRTLDADAALAADAGAAAVFAPSAQEMYPAGYDTYVETGGITDALCGKSRPGHFRGVTTVLTKLFHLVQPQRAYFGQKDAQQLLVVQKMVPGTEL